MNRHDALVARNLVHGLYYDETGKRSRLYSIWSRMRQRCRDQHSCDFARYGGRGIRVCDEWLDYRTFYAWAMANGYADNLTIDRKNNDGNYEPGNCRWIPAELQARNKNNNHLVTFQGVTKTLAEWSEDLHIDSALLRYRLKHWNIDKALTEPIRRWQ